MDIKGLIYIDNYLPQNLIDEIRSIIFSGQIEFKCITSNPNSRRVKHYGYNYSYNRAGLKVADPIPDFINKLISYELRNYLKEHTMKDNFDQVIINEYRPKEKISYHIDNPKQFGEIIACITIGEPVPIKFKLEKEVKTLIPNEGSIYVLTEDARYKWSHSSTNNTKGVRYSITFRTINPLYVSN